MFRSYHFQVSMRFCHFLLNTKRHTFTMTRIHAPYMTPSSSLDMPFESVAALTNNRNVIIVNGSIIHFTFLSSFTIFYYVYFCINQGQKMELRSLQNRKPSFYNLQSLFEFFSFEQLLS